MTAQSLSDDELRGALTALAAVQGYLLMRLAASTDDPALALESGEMHIGDRLVEDRSLAPDDPARGEAGVWLDRIFGMARDLLVDG